MPNDPSSAPFQSILAPFMKRFLQEKHACGYRYHEPTRNLAAFGRFSGPGRAEELRVTSIHCPKMVSQKDSRKPQNHQQRIMVVRQFSRFVCRLGYCAYVPDSTLAPRGQSSFTPRILTPGEIQKLLQAVDPSNPPHVRLCAT